MYQISRLIHFNDSTENNTSTALSWHDGATSPTGT